MRVSKTIQVIDLAEGGERVFYEREYDVEAAEIIRALVALLEDRGDVAVKVVEGAGSVEWEVVTRQAERQWVVRFYR